MLLIYFALFVIALLIGWFWLQVFALACMVLLAVDAFFKDQL